MLSWKLLKNLCKNLPNKLNALTRIAPYLDHNLMRLLYNSFLRRQLCLLLTYMDILFKALTDIKNRH